MKNLFFMSLILLPVISCANSCGKEQSDTYIFGDEKREMCWLKEEKIRVSPDCVKNRDCEALKIAFDSKKMAEISLSSNELRGGKNPATVLCGKVGGFLMSARYGINKSYFCGFSDGSIIEPWSLYSIYNDIRAKLEK